MAVRSDEQVSSVGYLWTNLLFYTLLKKKKKIFFIFFSFFSSFFPPRTVGNSLWAEQPRPVALCST